GLPQVEDHIGPADDRVDVPAVGGFERLGDRVVRPVGQVVAVNNQQRTLAGFVKVKHAVLMIADTMTGAMAADLMLRGAHVVTLDPAHPRATSVAIKDGRILAIDEDLSGPNPRELDLRGRAVVPGFVDAHIHFGSFALARQQADLDASPTLEDALELLRQKT